MNIISASVATNGTQIDVEVNWLNWMNPVRPSRVQSNNSPTTGNSFESEWVAVKLITMRQQYILANRYREQAARYNFSFFCQGLATSFTSFSLPLRLCRAISKLVGWKSNTSRWVVGSKKITAKMRKRTETEMEIEAHTDSSQCFSIGSICSFSIWIRLFSGLIWQNSNPSWCRHSMNMPCFTAQCFIFFSSLFVLLLLFKCWCLSGTRLPAQIHMTRSIWFRFAWVLCSECVHYKCRRWLTARAQHALTIFRRMVEMSLYGIHFWIFFFVYNMVIRSKPRGSHLEYSNIRAAVCRIRSA